jgi:hypothetical protein
LRKDCGPVRERQVYDSEGNSAVIIEYTAIALMRLKYHSAFPEPWSKMHNACDVRDARDRAVARITCLRFSRKLITVTM